ncbi:MAG: hypothetical protein MUO23_05580, partial [Anaerolineales bacterium]|nr:hypothetical protein [Anaerolineales bacterium]
MVRHAGGLRSLSIPLVALGVMAVVIALALLAAWVLLRMRKPSTLGAETAREGQMGSCRWLAGIAAGLLPLAMTAALLTFEDYQPGCARGLVYACVVVLEALLLAAAFPGLRSEATLAMALIGPAVVWKVAAFVPAISTTPFSMGWSEASRYYYASLFDSQAVYGLKTAWPVLHPSRYLLLAVPFFVGDLPIWAHRLWQGLLWIGMTAAVAGALARRWAGKISWRFILFSGWAFLFLFQGPVYYHLALGVLPLLLGFRWDRPWRNLALVVVGSIWAGLSRVNWVPVPGLLASALLALESPTGEGRGWSLRDWRWPVIWVTLGSLTAVLAGAVYAQLSGNSLDQFASSFSSDLLWYRLLPNPTYPLGILPGIAIASLPVALLLLGSARQAVLRDPYRLVLLGGILTVLLLGGLIVSVKIGGGGDLHNLDAFLLLSLVVGGSLWGRWRAAEGEGAKPIALRSALIGLVLAIPAAIAMANGQVLERPDAAAGQMALSELRTRLESSAGEGPVLFLTQRHLLTFGEIDLPLVEPYEKVQLMEMAMSRNPGYLEQFRRDLEAHRFAQVVTDSLN